MLCRHGPAARPIDVIDQVLDSATTNYLKKKKFKQVPAVATLNLISDNSLQELNLTNKIKLNAKH